MLKSQKAIYWTVIMSETGHLFCCALPAILGILSFFSAFGMIGIVPHVLLDLHDFMHRWEVPVIAFSAALLGFGWWLYRNSLKLDCSTEHTCGHPPCKPKKDRTKIVLLVASVLFGFNFTLYLFFHDGVYMWKDSAIEMQSHNDHDHNHIH